MFTRKFGKITLNTLIYGLILTLTYIVVIALATFTVHTLILFAQEALNSTFGLGFNLNNNITELTLILIFPSTFLAIYIVDKKLYKLRMLLKIENVYIFKKSLPALSIVAMLSIILGFLIAKDFYISKNIFESVENVISNYYSLVLDNFKDTVLLTRRTSRLHVYNVILYIPYTFIIYKLLLPKRKAFNFDFDDGVYINKELVEFNKYFVVNLGSDEEDKKHYFYDFFTTFHIYKDSYKRLKIMDKKDIEGHPWHDNTIAVYISKTKQENFSIVSSTNISTLINAHYYLTNTDLESIINALPTSKIIRDEEDDCLTDIENNTHNNQEEVERLEGITVNEVRDEIIIDPYRFDPNYLYASSGKTNVGKSLISLFLVALCVITITSTVGFFVTYAALQLGFDYQSILVGIVRYASYLFISTIIVKISKKIYKSIKMESFILNGHLAILITIVAFLLYNASIFLAIELDYTGNISQSLQNVVSNYGTLFIREINVNIQVGSLFTLPMLITVISKIVMFLTIYMTDFGERFDLDGVYINQEYVPFKIITVFLDKNIIADESKSKDFDYTSSTIMYFDQIKNHLVRCYENTVYVDDKKLYNIYYGYCRNLQKTIIICTEFKDIKIKRGKIKRIPSSGFIQEYLVYENEIGLDLEKIKFDENIENQFNIM